MRLYRLALSSGLWCIEPSEAAASAGGLPTERPKWGDLYFENMQMNVSRGIVHGVVGDVKIEASRKALPMAPVLADVLRDWKDRSKYRGPDNWMFASPRMHGKQPLWPDMLLKYHIRPAQ
jgi:hypothetical protein